MALGLKMNCNIKMFDNTSLNAVKRLLSRADLPVLDIDERSPLTFFGADYGDGLVGVIGLECFENIALLRSLAVDLSYRGKGVGTTLVTHVEQFALENDIRTIYLLTITADVFFRRLGYTDIPREDAPAEISTTREFSRICPASAAFLVKILS